VTNGLPSGVVAAIRPGGRLWEFAGYFMGSAAALACDVAVMVLCVEVFGLHYLLGAGLGFVSGAVLLYLLSTRVIFHVRRLKANGREFPIFFLVGVMGLLLTQAGMALFVEGLGWPYLLAKAITVAGVFCFNYLVRQDLLFAETSRLARLAAAVVRRGPS
jgi:putative flippase GtrA